MDTNNADLPAPPAGYKYMPCRYCGKPMLARTIRKKPLAHIECSTVIQMESFLQIRNKKGPYYERWLKGVMEAAKLASQGIPPQDE
jgi:hypothetical protein